MAHNSKKSINKNRPSKQNVNENKLGESIDDKSNAIPIIPNAILNNETTIPVIGLCSKKVGP